LLGAGLPPGRESPRTFKPSEVGRHQPASGNPIASAPAAHLARNQVEHMQIDSVASPGAPWFADLRFHRHLCRTCSLRSLDDAAIAFGVIYEASTAPCGSNAFHARSKRKLAIAPSEIFNRPTGATCSGRRARSDGSRCDAGQISNVRTWKTVRFLSMRRLGPDIRFGCALQSRRF
jgi:hypothetical protein